MHKNLEVTMCQENSSQLPKRFSIKDRFRGFYPVVVDVETAGFNPETDALLEVAMMTITMDDNGYLQPDEIMSANIRPFPNSNIEPSNIAFLGIDPFDESRNLQDERVAVLPMFKAISKKMKKEGCTRAILVGHNGFFDLSFIHALAKRLNYKRCPFHQFTVFDTASLAGLVYGQTVLARACTAAGIEFEDDKAHGAKYDTLMECKLFCSIFNRYTLFAGFPDPIEQTLLDFRAHLKDKEDPEKAPDSCKTE